MGSVFGVRVHPSLVLTACLGLSACVAPPLPSSRGGDERQRIAAAERFAANGDFAAASSEYRRAAEAAALRGDAASRAELLLLAGEAALRGGDRNTARVLLSDALRHNPRGARQRAVLLRGHSSMGDADFLDGSLENARFHYGEALDAATGTLQRDAVRKRLALLELRRGDDGAAAHWQARIQMPDSPALAQIERALAATTASPRPRPSDLPDPAAPKAFERLPSMPLALSRREWNARPLRGDRDAMGRIWRITVHHSGVRFDSTARGSAARAIQGFQRFHQDEKKWADIGYHFLIDPAGRVWQGRPLEFAGAHAGNPELNRGNVGIALLGDFSQQRLPRAQAVALLQWIAELAQRYTVRPEHLYSHQDIRPGHTECPGRELAKFVADVQRSARRVGFAPKRGGLPGLGAVAPLVAQQESRPTADGVLDQWCGSGSSAPAERAHLIRRRRAVPPTRPGGSSRRTTRIGRCPRSARSNATRGIRKGLPSPSR